VAEVPSLDDGEDKPGGEEKILSVLLVEPILPEAKKLEAALHQGVRKLDLLRLPALDSLADETTIVDFDLVVIGPGLPFPVALRFVERLAADHPHLPVIVISSSEDLNLAVEMMRAGAADYLVISDLTRLPLSTWKLASQAQRWKKRQPGEEARYRSLFEDSPISLWEEDFSGVKRRIENLRRQGVTDFSAYFQQHPEVVAEFVEMVKITDVNKATLILYAASSKEELLSSLDLIMPPHGYRMFQEELLCISQGMTRFRWQGINRRLDGKEIIVNLSWSAAPGYEETLGKILVSIEDVTERRRAEEEIKRLFLAERNHRRLAEALREAANVLSATLDYTEVLDGLLGQVARVVPFDTGYVFMVDGDTARLARLVCQEDIHEDTEHILALHIPTTANLQWMAETCLPLVISDTASYPGWLPSNSPVQMRSYVGVPVLAHGQLVAFLALRKKQVAFYTEEHAERLAAFAGQTALALQNARLYQEAVKAAERRQILHQASRELNATLDPEQLYVAIHKAAAQLMSTEAFVISLINEAKREIDAVYLIDRSGRHPAMKSSLDNGMSGQVISSGQSLYIPDFSVNMGVKHVHFGDPHEVRSILAVPMYRQGTGKAFGILSAQSYSPNAYTPDDQALLELLAAHAATAIENARLFAEVQTLALTDPLTGLFNRRYFLALSVQECERSRRYHHPLSLMLMDIDDFKRVNDTYSYTVGDQVLVAVTELCAARLRKSDVFCRWGGEEFMVLLPETNLEDAREIAERLREQVFCTPIETETGQVSVSISIGVAELNDQYSDLDGMRAEVDEALHLAKKAGKNRVWVKASPS